MNLGNSSAVISKWSNQESIEFSIKKDGGKITFKLLADLLNSQLFLSVDKIEQIGKFEENPILKKEFYYLNAERIGPRIFQEMCHQDFLNTGVNGEFTAQVLSENSGLYKINNSRLFPDSKNPQLLFQTNKWLNFILPNTRINILPNPSTNAAQIVIENEYTISDPVLSTNIGFGISYVLPIIVTSLVAKENSIIIIENPEAHLVVLQM